MTQTPDIDRQPWPFVGDYPDVGRDRVMPAYVFHLHDGLGGWRDEAVAADGLEEARDLAELRLLAGVRVTRVEVFENGELRLNIRRGRG